MIRRRRSSAPNPVVSQVVAGGLITLTARRVGAGAETLVFRTSGSMNTGFYESGLPVSLAGFDSLSVQGATSIATVVPTTAPISVPAPFIAVPTPTPLPTAVPGGGTPPLRFEPPSEPSSFVAAAGLGSIVLTWAVPDDTSGRPIDEYMIQNLKTGEIVRVSGDVLTFTFSDLNSDLEYYFTIKASTGLGVGLETGTGPIAPLPLVSTVAPVAESTLVPVVTAVPTATEVPDPTVTPVATVILEDIRSDEIVVSSEDGDELERVLEGITGSALSVEEAVVAVTSGAEGITIGITVDGMTPDAELTGALDVQVGDLSLSVVDGEGTAELRIVDDIVVVGSASVSSSTSALDVQISDPQLRYTPSVPDDGSFAGTGSGNSSNSAGDAGVSFAVDLDVLPSEVGLTTTYSADAIELESQVGTTFALTGDDELAYFVVVEKSGITQDDLGDNTVSMSVSSEWLDEMVAHGREVAITKISDSGVVFTENAQCERLSDKAVCTVTFSGEAGGFSIFAIYGFVNTAPQSIPEPLSTPAPATPVPSPVPSATAIPTATVEPEVTPLATATPIVTAAVAPAPTAENVEIEQPVSVENLGDDGDGGGPSLIVIVAIGIVAVAVGGSVLSAYYRRPDISTTALFVIAVTAGSAVLLAGNTSVAQADGLLEELDSDLPTFDSSRSSGFNKYDYRFRKVGSSIRALKEAQAAGNITEWEEIVEQDLTDEIIDVAIKFDSPDSIDIELIERSAIVLNSIGEVVEVQVPVSLAHQLSYLPGVLRVEQIVPPEVQVTSEGTTVHKSPAWNTLGLDGTGIKVGIIDVGFESWSSISPSELPTPAGIRCYTSVGVFTSTLADCENGQKHGTAVAEAVDDIAPAIELYIANPMSGSDLLATTLWMAEQGVEIINHSVAWSWDGPGDGTSPNANSPLKSIDQAVVDGILWVNAAGNSAEDHWYGSYSDTNGNDYLNLSGSLEYQTIQNTSSSGRIELRWEDSWEGAASDLRLYLTDSSNQIWAISDGIQSGEAGQIPREIITAEIVSGDRIWVEHISGPAPDWVQVVVWGSLGLSDPTAARSVVSPAESANAGMLAVGAARYSSTSNIESFSSQGPTTDGRTKPEIVGADGATSTAYGGAWYGTSLAAPHVAGLAALALQRFPSMTPSELATYLKTSAADRGTAGVDNTWGYGFAELAAPTAPNAVADSYSVDEDSVLNVAVAGVLTNDSDDADSFVPLVVSTPTNASAFSLAADGSFSYQPNANFNGSDSFTYKDVDAWQESSAVSVNLTVNAIADISGTVSVQGSSAPTGVAASVTSVGSSTGTTDYPVSVGGGFGKHLGADSVTYTAAAPGYISRARSDSETTADHDLGTVVLRSGDTDGDADVDSADAIALLAAFVAGLPSAATRDDSFGNTVDLNNDDVVDAIDLSLWASNYGLEGPMAWTTVPTTPPLAIGDDYWVYMGNRLTVGGSGVLGNDHDQESDSLTAAAIDLPSHGSLSLNSDGSFTYDPDSGFTGLDSFTYVAADAQTKSITTTVTIDVRTAPATTVGTTVGSTVGSTIGSTAGSTVGSTVGG